MPEVEIRKPIQLDNPQRRLLDLHSALNILTIISNEIGILEILSQFAPELKAPRQAIETLKSLLLDDKSALKTSQQTLQQLHHQVLEQVSSFLAQHPTLQCRTDLSLFEKNLDTLFDILEIRYQELQVRSADPLCWGKISPQALRNNWIHVFEAMELNSHHRYHIVYDAAEKQPSDYLIEIEILCPDPHQIEIPLVLQDIMRDLSANARKYSEPGSRIQIRLEDDGTLLKLSVSDQGRGIPADELENVVDFGHRGSNVHDKRSMGGGFGLTKAWYFTQQLGGRLWIASELGQGTQIRIEIPKHKQHSLCNP